MINRHTPWRARTCHTLVATPAATGTFPALAAARANAGRQRLDRRHPAGGGRLDRRVSARRRRHGDRPRRHPPGRRPRQRRCVEPPAAQARRHGRQRRPGRHLRERLLGPRTPRYQQNPEAGRWNGSTWQNRAPADRTVGFQDIRAVSATAVRVAEGTAVLRWNDATWSRADVTVTAAVTEFTWAKSGLYAGLGLSRNGTVPPIVRWNGSGEEAYSDPVGPDAGGYPRAVTVNRLTWTSEGRCGPAAFHRQETRFRRQLTPY